MNTSHTKKRILFISKSGVLETYREKFFFLARHGKMDIGLICPMTWRKTRFEPSLNDKNIWIRKLRIVGAGFKSFYIFLGIEAEIKAFKPDLIVIEEEADSLVAYQVSCIAKRLAVATVIQVKNQKNYSPFSLRRYFEKYTWNVSKSIFAETRYVADLLKKASYAKKIFGVPRLLFDVGLMNEQVILEKERLRQKRLIIKAVFETKSSDDIEIEIEREFWIGCVGAFRDSVGISDLIKSFAWLLKQRSCRLILVGMGPYTKACQTLVKKLKVHERVTFLGTVSSMNFRGFLKAIDVMCIPSTFNEKRAMLSAKFLSEGMACGAVPLGPSLGVVPEIIGKAGLVFANREEEDLKFALKALMDDPSFLQQCRRLSYERAKKHFSCSILMDALLCAT